MLESKKPDLLSKSGFFNVVGIAGFEPAISCPPDKRLTGLGHIPRCFLVRTKIPRQLLGGSLGEAELYQFT